MGAATALAEAPELAADVEARAYGGALDAPYDHPLLEPDVLDLVATGDRTTDELIHDLRWFNHISVAEDGTVTRWRGAELVDSEPADPDLVDWDGTEPATAEGPLVGASLQALLDAGDTGAVADGSVEDLDVVLSLDKLSWNPIVSVEHELMLAMLEGRVETRRDALTVRHEAMLAKEAAGAAALEPLLAWLDELGVEVVSWSGLTGSVQVRVGSDRLAELVEYEGLAHVDEVVEEEVSAGYPLGTEVDGVWIDGVERENLLQSTQFYDDGYYGDSDGYIGMEEGGGDVGGSSVRRAHLGFDDASGSDRYQNCASVSGSTCGSNPNPTTGNEHATEVASVLLGDITRGQDTSAPSPTEKRSGVARRAHGLGTAADADEVVDVMTLASRDIHLMNHLAGDIPTTCDGTSWYAQQWNALYEGGIAVFMAAGNNGHSGSGCTVKDPGSALGVFSVGAYVVDSIDDEQIRSDTSRGGGVIVGPHGLPLDDGRTIIDVLGPTDHSFAYAYESTAMNQYNGIIRQTSGATPAVAGSAALFRDWFLDEEGTAIDSPGLLYANLLLMGDRMDESGNYLNIGYDELTGAGKLRLRMFDYLDGPAEWDTGSLCVDHETTNNLTISAGHLSSDVDMIKAVIWWYDHRHDGGTVEADKVRLALQSYNSATSTWVTHRASNTDDHKQRVYFDGPTNSGGVRLQITGRDVTSDSEGCGTDSTRVYYAWMYEDQDRDTGTDLDDLIRPEH